MKAFLALLFVLLLGAVLTLRGYTAFPDRQIAGGGLESTVVLDPMAMAERLAGALRIPTISHDDRSNFDADAFRKLHAYLEAQFPVVHAEAQRRRINSWSLVYRIDGTNPDLAPALFMGHLDVVPVDPATADDWQHDPFSGAIADGAVWGRGAMDDKLTVLALLEAMEALLAAGERPARTVYFAFGHDEEVGGKEGAAEVAAAFAREGLRFEFVLDEGGFVTEGLMPGIKAPVATIGIAEKGYANLNLTVEASGGHSSQPPAHTAAGILAKAIVRVEDNPFPADLSAMDANFAYLAHHFPLANRVALANPWLFEPLVEWRLLATPLTAALIRTTTAVTMLEGSSKSNVLPTRAEAVVNFRILPGDTVASVREHVIAAIDDERVDVSVHQANEPSPVSATDSFGFRLLEATIRGMDSEILVAPYLVLGGTDAKHFVDLSDSVYRFVMFRADGETLRRMHGVNERVAIADYEEAVRFYHALMSNLSPQRGRTSQR